jgi:5-(carboxyamino)imidazole ribonucleotide mutase
VDDNKAKVGILMGSDSDIEVMKEAAVRLASFGVRYEMHISSAHRSPMRTHEYARGAADRGIEVLIVGAGAAAHLAGVVSAATILPVIGVPLDGSALNGMDALLATVQMPAGVPVATMAIGKAGAANAGIFAVQILARGDQGLAEKLGAFKAELANGVEVKDARLQKDLKA